MKLFQSPVKLNHVALTSAKTFLKKLNGKKKKKISTRKLFLKTKQKPKKKGKK